MAGAEHDPMRPVRPDGSQNGPGLCQTPGAPSRRQLLAAALAAPFLPAAAAAAEAAGQGSAPRAALAKWRRAWATYRRADSALSAVTGTADDALYNRLGASHDRALVRLLTTPAPHAAALADKLDLLIAHQAWELRAADACLAALSKDARRLAEPPNGRPATALRASARA